LDQAAGDDPGVRQIKPHQLVEQRVVDRIAQYKLAKFVGVHPRFPSLRANGSAQSAAR
jgi:hypothetical protein